MKYPYLRLIGWDASNPLYWAIEVLAGVKMEVDAP